MLVFSTDPQPTLPNPFHPVAPRMFATYTYEHQAMLQLESLQESGFDITKDHEDSNISLATQAAMEAVKGFFFDGLSATDFALAGVPPYEQPISPPATAEGPSSEAGLSRPSSAMSHDKAGPLISGDGTELIFTFKDGRYECPRKGCEKVRLVFNSSYTKIEMVSSII